jgi:hypothetical protein
MWKLNPAQRLERWRELRHQMSQLPLDEALDICAQFWAPAPTAPWYLETNDINNWPDPWQLIQDNYYCPLAKALGMLYTIDLSEHTGVDLEIRVYNNQSDRAIHNLVWIDQGKYVLNSEDAVVLNKTHITQDYKLQFKISSNELKLDRY